MKLLPIFYGTWSDSQKTLILNFLAGLGGSRWMDVHALYWDSTNCVANNQDMLGASFTYPTNTLGASLTFTQVASLVTGAANTLGRDPSAIYLVLTGPEIDQRDGTTGFCTHYCGWHSHVRDAGFDLKYIWVGKFWGSTSSDEASPDVQCFI
jgi:hypothetical protein